ncbi:MAG: propionate--CoA ligase [Paucibacter sp.]|nr:propionate--CoA ligase [Roseateles sp.]
MKYEQFHARSLSDRDAFWAEEARAIDWQASPQIVCDTSKPPFARWFVGGRTNLCHNALDRHAAVRGEQVALAWVSTEVGQERCYTYRELLAEVECLAAMMKELGVGRGDRVLIYMPMVAEGVMAMLACARIGAIHSVVFGGFASGSLATRIDDASPKLIVSADAGSRGGKIIAYKPLLDEAIRLSLHKPQAVLLLDRGLAPMVKTAGRDHDYAAMRARLMGTHVPCEWLEATEPSYTLYTSGTTGRPKGVQRDTGGYAVALAASMKYIFGCKPGETYFCTSDIGWTVGHSYIVYGPLITGMTAVMYEGLPIQPDAAVWWGIVEKYKANVMFSSPTAIRILKKHDEALLRRHDLSSLRALFLAGEPLDEPTAQWISKGIGVPIIDNYWQTETGWPMLTLSRFVPDLEPQVPKFGSPGKAVFGYDARLLDESTGEEITEPGKKGVLTLCYPMPPGCLQTVWGDDERFVKTYWSSVPGRQVYSTFDWATRDTDGYFFIMGRTDDVINVAGHRLGTREIEECISGHSNVAEVAVVGVQDELKGQVAMAFVVLRRPVDDVHKEEAAILQLVDRQLGAVARPARVRFVTVLPKTRSGKLLRRAIQALCEQRDPGDLSTIEDPGALQQIRELLA